MHVAEIFPLSVCEIVKMLYMSNIDFFPSCIQNLICAMERYSQLMDIIFQRAFKIGKSII